MSYFHIGIIIATAAILKVSPQNVDIFPKHMSTDGVESVIIKISPQTVVVSPDYIITDVGKSATFTCAIELDPVSATSEHRIKWYRSCNFEMFIIARGDTVIDKNKYSLHEISSIASSNFTQSLTVHGIEEDDNCGYICIFETATTTTTTTTTTIVIWSDSSYLVVKNILPTIYCYTNWQRNVILKSSIYDIETDLDLVCSIYPGDPPITLQWIDEDGNVLAEETQSEHSYLSVNYTVPTKSLHQSFTCVATNSASVTPAECMGTPIMTDGTIDFSFTHNQSTVGVTETTEMSITSNSNKESGLPDEDCNTVTAMLSVIAAISILANVAFSSYILIRKRKKKNQTTEVGTINTIQVGSEQQHGVFEQGVGEDGYLEPIKVGEDGYMEPLAHIQDQYKQLSVNVE